MDLIDKKFLKTNKALKKFGQNFLIDEKIIKKIINCSGLKKKDTVLEIGPGLGSLTNELAKKTKKVIAIEKDKRLAKWLKNNLTMKNVSIIEADALHNNYSLPKKYNLIANLPYNIAVAIIRKFLEQKNQPQKMILMLQKEVAEKICSKKGSLIKMSVVFYGKPEFLFSVSKKAFFPQPTVDGGVIKISNIHKPKISEKLFFKILKIGFSQPRKTILNNLSDGLEMDKKEIIKKLKDLKIEIKLTYSF